MPKIVGNPTVTPMAVPDWDQNDSTKADYIKNKPDIYTKNETDAKLNEKVSKEDISNVYRFKGSVDTFEDLPQRYALIPNIDIEKGIVPTLNGEPLEEGNKYVYDAETHTLELINVTLIGSDTLSIPIVPINVKSGKYYAQNTYYGDASIGGIDTYECNHSATYIPMSDGTIDYVNYYTYSYPEITIDGETDDLGSLFKITDSWLIDEDYPDLPYIPSGAFDNGNVYNVLDTDMNYAWTGTEWDALGGTVGGGGGEIDSSHISNTNNPHKVTAEQIGAYTKSEVDSQLNNKANKSDIANVYRFRGSVETKADLPFKYDLVLDGTPIYENGDDVPEDLYTYDAESGSLTISHSVGLVLIPIKKLPLTAGNYGAYGDGVCTNSYCIGLYDENYQSALYVQYNAPNVGGYLSHDDVAKYIGIYEGCNISNGYVTTIYKASPDMFEEVPEGEMYEGASLFCGNLDNGCVYNVNSDGMNYAWTGTEWDALGGVSKDEDMQKDIDDLKDTKADKSSVYTKSEVNTELNKKVNKEDLVSAYKFCGSVEKFEDLPFKWELIPSDNALEYPDGTPLSDDLYEYNSDAHTITFKVNIYEGVVVPIVPITIPKGYYYCDYWFCNAPIIVGDNFLNTSDFDDKALYDINFKYNDEEKTINKITLLHVQQGEYTTSTLYKAVNTWYYDKPYPDGSGNSGKMAYIPSDAYDNGNVYNVIKGGMNYAWTGTEWDALGGEHRDMEARWQIGNVDAALDTILEIQNSLIGGDSV